jgi:hypothetical protein
VFVTILDPVEIVFLLGFGLENIGYFAGLIARIVVIFALLLLAGLMLVRILVVGHGSAPLLLRITVALRLGSLTVLRPAGPSRGASRREPAGWGVDATPRDRLNCGESITSVAGQMSADIVR